MNLHRNTKDTTWALALAERASKRATDSLSDSALASRLEESARALYDSDSTLLPEKPLADSLAIAGVAIRRRMGVWRAVLEDPDELSGPIRQIRLLADELLDPTNPNAPVHSISQHKTLRQWAGALSEKSCLRADMKVALHWLLIALVRIRSEHPPRVHFPPECYRSLRALDADNCLLFAPTERQLAAASLLLSGAIVEMDAGEGKTLASAIAALVFAAAGRHVHILTANDYLASRDCDDLAFTIESLGFAPGLVTANMDSNERRFQYPRPIVFTTAREVGFDYLRDNIARRPQFRVAPAFDVAIVDEADHLLIDQARAPLIISGEPVPEYHEDDLPENLAVRIIEEQAAHVDSLYSRLDVSSQDDDSTDRTLAAILLAEGLTPRLVSALEKLGKSARRSRHALLLLNDDDEGRPLEADLLFAIDAAGSTLRITERGWEFIADRLDQTSAAFEVAQILRARVIHDSGEDYVVDADGITLVDRLDGRPMADHRYLSGLHEAIESKEGIEGRDRANPVARATIHSLMSNYAAIAGLTGTATEAEDTFARDYGIRTVRVPPTFAPRRIDLETRVFFDKREHTRALSDEVFRWHSLGRPVLLAFGSVGESAAFSDVLERRGIAHRVLNASNPLHESEIVARAGEFGAVTVSTGMAGRGADIIVSDDVERRIAENLGRPVSHVEDSLGLVVIIASLPASQRVERQIRGRAARQGSPGASTMTLYVYDPVLAFTRQQTELFQMRKPGDKFVGGPEVQNLLRRAQIESESQNRAIAEASFDFAAIIESESRAHYAARESIMDFQACPQLLARDSADWIERKTAPLYNLRADYHGAFDSVAESLWNEHGIDIGYADSASPAEAVRRLTLDVENRLFQRRTRLGDRRFAIAISDMYIEALDSLWPDHLAALQDIALSIALGAAAHAAAVTQFAAEAQSAGSELRRAAADSVIASLLDSEYIEPQPDIEENRIERLPSELSQLIT